METTWAQSAPTPAPLEVVDFHKAYDAVVAVEGLTFEVQPGRILGLVGPNGAGKTTTLRAISGVIPPTRGRIAVAGHDLAVDPVAAKSRLAYVPDDPRLFDTLTVWEHLRFIAAAYRVADFESRAEELLTRFELLDKRKTLAQELSRGMRQKLAICCAYLHDPALLLMDEPHTGLDPRGIRTLTASLLERAAAGSAIIVSSHILALVEHIASHLLIIHRGQALYQGTIGDVRGAFTDLGGDASLEEVFFRATEGGAPPDGR